MHNASPMFLAIFGMVACTGAPHASETHSEAVTETQTRASPTTGGLERVADPSLVCMVNDRFMGIAQIPIAAAGQTYYGCCENCIDRIQSDPEIRSAIDPVTGASVDKATAVIGRDAENNLFYFESEESLALYPG